MKIKTLFAAFLIAVSFVFPVNAEQKQEEQRIGENILASTSAADIAAGLVSGNALVYDYDTDQVLLNRNADTKIYPASMTKLMTALLFAENVTDWNETITITDEMLAGLYEANASVVGYGVGSAPDMNSILYGILLPSGADAVNAAAIYVSGDIAAFVDLMNAKAAELGMDQTHFANPTGLHDDNHYSTCLDIAKLLKAAISNTAVKQAISTANYTDNLGITMDNTWYSSMLNAGLTVPGFTGGKTGYTDEAGHCLASFGTINDMDIITVTAEAMTGYYSYDNISDAAALYNWLASDYSRKTILKGESVVKTVTIKHMFHDEEVNVIAPSSINLDTSNDAVITVDCTIPDEIECKSDTQEVSGEIIVSSNGTEIHRSNVQLTVPKEANWFAWLLLKIKSVIFD